MLIAVIGETMGQDNKKRQLRKVPTVISEGKAVQLCQSGEWITDLKVSDRIQQKSKDILANFQDWSSSNQTASVYALTEFFQLCPIILSESEAVEANRIMPQFDPGYNLELRIKAGVVFKLKSAALDLGINSLGLILAIFSTTAWPLYFPVWLGLSLTVLIRTLYRNLESIRDPDEKVVFEAIFRCQGRFCIVNYVALKDKNYDEAYGFVLPTVSDLSAEIKGQISEKEIGKALASLESRGIVKERNSRWSISF